MCMRANVVDAFLLRGEVLRCQWQRGVQHCLSSSSANQPSLDRVRLDKKWDKNGQRALAAICAMCAMCNCAICASEGVE
jgi:hypothetical protein